MRSWDRPGATAASATSGATRWSPRARVRRCSSRNSTPGIWPGPSWWSRKPAAGSPTSRAAAATRALRRSRPTGWSTRPSWKSSTTSSPMPLTDDQIRLLSRATEDWTGLYEAVWELRTGQPRLADTELLRRAKNALSELVRRNLVYICRLQSRPATEEEATRYAADAGFSSESRRWQTPVETPVAPD